MAGGLKKWFMLQVWRLHQVAAIITLALLALNLSLQMFYLIEWRGGILGNPYVSVPALLLLTGASIWAVAVVWDLRMKMWREQMAVAIERNPYTKEKIYSKELLTYAIVWVPMMERLARDEPRLNRAADAMKTWMRKALADDPALRGELNDLLKYIGDYPEDMVNFD